ncbi:MAG: phosphatase PAP2 family protein [Acidimicrobiales bacterium]
MTTTVAAVVLVDSARRARAHRVSPTEACLFRTVNQLPGRAHLPAWTVMQSGSLAAVFVVAAGLARSGRRRTGLAALIAGTAVWAGVKLVKPRVGRGRPSAHLELVSVRGQTQTGLGYPSGHAAVALTLALIASHDAGAFIRTAAIVVAAVTGGARIYVGAHLPLDVAGGLAIGLFCGRAAIGLLENVGGSGSDDESDPMNLTP